MKVKGLISSVLFISILVAGSAWAADGAHFLADRHADRGVKCESCHEGMPAPGMNVDQTKCLACHQSLDAVAERTNKLDPNPHYNHLVGLNCLECHRGHKEGINMCGSCHNLRFKVP